MQTSIVQKYANTPQGQQADSILRKCVHCGFCTATCPTYQLLGDELDSPRGRIYLIKQMLEGAEVTEKTRNHLDRCLTCRSCETTCPSGVEYGKLVDIGRDLVEKEVPRGFIERLTRQALISVLPNRPVFNALLKLGQTFKPMVPGALGKKIPPKRAKTPWPAARHARRMLVLDACAQPGATPNVNASAARVLDRLGISLVTAPEAGCCGAVAYHLNDQAGGLDAMRANIDAWWPEVEKGCEAIVITASGCGVMVKEYGHLLAGDAAYAEKAKRIAELCKDMTEVFAAESLESLNLRAPGQKVAFHAPCTLQHGQKIIGVAERYLREAGFELTMVADSHLCCGSAGTYSITQPELSQSLLKNKVEALEAGRPDVIATANIGCHLHIETGAQTPVKHWIELIDDVCNA